MMFLVTRWMMSQVRLTRKGLELGGADEIGRLDVKGTVVQAGCSFGCLPAREQNGENGRDENFSGRAIIQQSSDCFWGE